MALAGHQDEQLILNTTKLTGIQAISFQQNIADAVVTTIGTKTRTPTVLGPNTITAQIDKIVVNDSLNITGLAGSRNISGQFIYGDNVMDFNSGVLAGYSLSSSIGEPPNISFDFEIFGGITGSGNSRASSTETIADTGAGFIKTTGISITHDKGTSNNIQSITYSETYNFSPEYSLGSLVPNINFLNNVTQTMEIELLVEDFSFDETFSFLLDSKERKRNIQFHAQFDGTGAGTGLNLTLESGHLVSESLRAGVGNQTIATLGYRGTKDLKIFPTKKSHGLLGCSGENFAYMSLIGSPSYLTFPLGRSIEYSRPTNQNLVELNTNGFVPLFNTITNSLIDESDPITQVNNFKISGVIYPNGIPTGILLNTWGNESIEIKSNGVPLASHNVSISRVANNTFEIDFGSKGINFFQDMEVHISVESLL
jgi:hypothetical protein